MSNTLKFKPPGDCIFCGRTGRLSKQHIFPDRLKKLIPRDSDHHFSAPIIIIPARDNAIFIQPKTLKKRNGNIGTRKSRIVCELCNGGWMRTAEEAAFDVITPIILGETPSLSQDDMEKIALFSGIIFSMADTDHPSTSAVSFEERSFMFRNHKLPPNWFLFMARTNSEYWKLRFYHNGAKTRPANSTIEPIRCNFHVCTIGMGNMVLHAVSGADDIWINDPQQYTDVHQMVRIGPSVRPVNLADLPILDEFEVSELAKALFMRLIEKSVELLGRI